MFQDWSTEWFSWHGLMSAIGLLVYALGSHALNQRRHPAAAIGWVMLIVLLPELGVPLYLLFGTRKLPKAKRQGASPLALEAADDVVPAWVQRLTAAMSLPPPASYRALMIHADGGQARDALFELIDGAHHQLAISTFILGRDRFGDELLARLARAARRGVSVRLLVDGMGTWMGGRKDFSAVQAAGVQVAQFVPPFRSPLRWPLRGRTNLRNHRKLVIADGQRLWSGGRNLSGEYFEDAPGRPAWTDLSFDLTGEIAAEAVAVFDSDWAFAHRPVRAAIGLPAPRDWPRGRIEGPAAQLLPSGPDYADDTVHTLLLTSCYRARSRILVVTPYLVPDESLLSALCLAARRGVAVDIVMPARSNHRLADIARNRPLRELAAAGAQLWLSSQMVHAKAVVIDDHMAMAGSLNLDSRSLFLNYELMVGFYSPDDIARLAAWIQAQRVLAHLYVARPPSLARYLGEGLVLWLAFQL